MEKNAAKEPIIFFPNTLFPLNYSKGNSSSLSCCLTTKEYLH